MAGRDRPNDIPDRDGTGWTRQVALAVNWLLRRDTGAVTSGTFALDDGSATSGDTFTFDVGELDGNSASS